jgi:hypothetical protein
MKKESKNASRRQRDLSGIGTDTWGLYFGLLGCGGLLANPFITGNARNDGMIE